jgi:hypothetical protein
VAAGDEKRHFLPIPVASRPRGELISYDKYHAGRNGRRRYAGNMGEKTGATADLYIYMKIKEFSGTIRAILP